jgi:hypothetical protein
MKDEQSVEDYKVREADKYLFGQSLNNATALICAYVGKGYVGMDKAESRFLEYQKCVRKLFEINKTLRKELLGY